MALKSTLLVLALACLAATTSLAARELSLSARLEAQGELMECWDALWEIKSCSNEIVVFFMNGSTDIGPACCKGISVITHNCWPAMLSSLGFTGEETDVLRGYCDASTSSSSEVPALSPKAESTSVAALNLSLSARLETQGGLMECWDALWEIKSCSNEIVLFFMNGSTDIGPACCKGISVITHNCWPSMLSSLGLTGEETDVLRGYCDASMSSSSVVPASSPKAATTSLVVKELSLSARLEAQGGLMECWDALWEIKACSNEIVLFFTNGSTDIGPACCKGINVITHNCWPAMLSSLGFTGGETDVLSGYCDASTSSSSVVPALSPKADTTDSVVMALV